MEAERLFRKYDIDFVDSLQIVTLMQGKDRIFVGALRAPEFGSVLGRPLPKTDNHFST